MKKLFILSLAIFSSFFSLAQTNIPQLVSFSAVVRDANNQLLVNTPVSIRLSFKQGGANGPLVYCALHQDSTNSNGFISIQLNREVLGTGCNGAPSTAFENIPWQNGGFWMEVEYQTASSSSFINLGQLELASSFYAFAAGTAERITNFNLSNAQDGNVISYNSSTNTWFPVAPSSNTTQIDVVPRIGVYGSMLSVSFSGGSNVSFAQASSTNNCPLLNPYAILSFQQASPTIIYPKEIYYINEKRFDALFYLDSYYPGMYDIIVSPGTPCEYIMSSSFKMIAY